MIAVVQLGKHGRDPELFVAREKDGRVLISCGGAKFHFDSRGAYLPEPEEATTQEAVVAKEPRKRRRRKS
jgi:hypothetical protein